MAPLTDRQQEIKALLEDGMSARDIAKHVGITRNAVYQHLQRLRRNGDLPPNFTPTGMPSREMMPGAKLLAQALGVEPSSMMDAGTAANVALLHEIKRTRDELVAMAHRLSELLPS